MHEIEEKIDIRNMIYIVRDTWVILDSEMFAIKYHERIMNYE